MTDADYVQSQQLPGARESPVQKVRKRMANKQKILIVDNDLTLAESLSSTLQKEFYLTSIVKDGQEAVREFSSISPDLILSELILPGMDGYQLCRQIRAISRIPIIIISSKEDVFDRVLALELGADDYIIKPIDPKELTARIKAVLRRMDPDFMSLPAGSPAGARSARKTVRHDDLFIDLTNYSVICRGEDVDMPPKEIELLYFLASSPNQVFTREQLLSNIWGYDYAGDTRTVDVHIKRLREKLQDHPHWSISTVWGVGYKFNLK